MISSVERSFEVVDALKELDGARVSEVADHLELANSTVHKHLATLHELGYVAKEGDIYHVGMRFLTTGGYVQNRKRGYQEAIEIVNELTHPIGVRSQFVVEEHGRCYYLHTNSSNDAIQIDRRIGICRHIHAGAAGKAILAHLPNARVDEIIDQWGLPPETEHTITDRKELIEELEEIRNRGYAYNDQESVNGLRAVGAPVMLPSGDVFGAFSIGGAAHRLQGDVFTSELPNMLLGHINELELQLAY